MKSFSRTASALATLLCGLGSAWAAAPLRPASDPPAVVFNHLHDLAEVEAILSGYAAAYPGWVTVEVIGKSGEGRDLWLVTLNNPDTGPDHGKPAMYVDGNTHGNEVQGTEATLYVLDFLIAQYGRLERITELVDRAAFYFVPVVNPDSRYRWFAGPSSADYPRTVIVPIDDDRDGLADEDGYDDLDGNGIITTMRKRVPLGEGGYRLHPKDPRLLIEVEADELGDWDFLGMEGIDNDGDGQVNEDGVGYVDPNRTWGYDWQPTYVQGGAGLYPLAIPETRSIALWAQEHPNIAGAQSFHNNGGMILRGPGAKSHPLIPPADLAAFDLIGEEGERILPGYEYLISWKDLYTTYGDTDAHFYRIVGAIAFTNELYNDDKERDLDADGEVSDEEEMEFNDHLTLGRQFVPFREIDHPQYGKVEVGGFRQDVERIPESWLFEEDVHRNAAFVLLHAHHLPKLAFGERRVRRIDKGLWRLEVQVINERATPSMTAEAKKSRLHRPDLATLEGAEVLASGLVEDRWLDVVELQEHRPQRLMVDGIPGIGSKTLYFLVAGKGEVRVTYDSLKGGKISTAVELKETPEPAANLPGDRRSARPAAAVGTQPRPRLIGGYGE